MILLTKIINCQNIPIYNDANLVRMDGTVKTIKINTQVTNSTLLRGPSVQKCFFSILYILSYDKYISLVNIV